MASATFIERPLLKMKKTLLTIFLSVLATSLTSCSVYQSRGRKLLQNEGYTYAGLAAVPNLESCGAVDNNKDWHITQANDEDASSAQETNLQAYEAEDSERFYLQLTDLEQTRSCQFQFDSEVQRDELLQSAYELTRLHFSLGEFAFSHKIPLK